MSSRENEVRTKQSQGAVDDREEASKTSIDGDTQRSKPRIKY